MVHKCKSGQHAWLGKEDAEKCCNGFRRQLVIYPKPGEVSSYYGWYGYRWVPANQGC